MIIVDNAMNVVSMTGDEWSGLREIAKAMHHIARETDAAVLLLHHTSESESRPDMPPSRKAIQGKIAQLPEMILTVAYLPFSNEFRVAAVKNRFAKHSASGDHFVTLYADASRMTMYNDAVSHRFAADWRNAE
jgi:RecA-family ATPase